MKNPVNLYGILIALGGLLSCTQAPKSPDASTSAPKAEAEATAGSTFTVDTTASTIEWIGTKVSGYHSGTVKLKNGQLTVSNGTITAGNFTMDMPTIVATGPKSVNAESNGKLTGHLHSADFFDVNKFPEATFAITGVKPFSGTLNEPDNPREEQLSKYKVANPTHTISGNLTIKGIEKNIEFPARITINDATAEAQAKFNIDRKQWGLVYTGKPDDLIRDEIHLGIYLKALK